MKRNNKIIYKNSIDKKYLSPKFRKKLNQNFHKIFKKIYKNLNNVKDSFHTLSKKFSLNFKISSLREFKRYKTIVVVGMGGSSLGSEAIYSFLAKKIKKKFIFLNTLDEDMNRKIKKIKDKEKKLFIIISKSGNTIETISNCLELNIFKKNKKNIILISEKGNNSIYRLSRKLNLFHIEHKKYVGGRYSVLSEVGLIPAYLMGINISKLRKNLLVHFSASGKKFLQDSTTYLANIIQNKKISSLIILNYFPALNKFLIWYQQLISESLGKSGKGLLPIISPAPKDHHSLLQLYLDGPKDKLFHIFSFQTKQYAKLNPKIFGEEYNFLKNKNFNQIRIAQKNAIIRSLKKRDIPFREFFIKDVTEENLGELFSYFILETAITGYLININPFNQPSVEQVKIDTKKLLS